MGFQVGFQVGFQNQQIISKPWKPGGKKDNEAKQVTEHKKVSNQMTDYVWTYFLIDHWPENYRLSRIMTTQNQKTFETKIIGYQT